MSKAGIVSYEDAEEILETASRQWRVYESQYAHTVGESLRMPAEVIQVLHFMLCRLETIDRRLQYLERKDVDAEPV